MSSTDVLNIVIVTRHNANTLHIRYKKNNRSYLVYIKNNKDVHIREL